MQWHTVFHILRTADSASAIPIIASHACHGHSIEGPFPNTIPKKVPHTITQQLAGKVPVRNGHRWERVVVWRGPRTATELARQSHGGIPCLAASKRGTIHLSLFRF